MSTMTFTSKKPQTLILVFTMILAMLLAIGIPPQVSAEVGTEECESLEVTLFAGQTIEAGLITVSNDGDKLYIKVDTKDGWEIKKIDLAIKKNLVDIPSAPGGFVPGLFPIKEAFNPFVTTYEFVYTLESLGFVAGDTIYIALHAEVIKDSEGENEQKETAWGNGTTIGSNWSMYFTYTIQDCDDDVNEDEVFEFVKSGSAWGVGTWIDRSIAQYFILDKDETDKSVILGEGRNRKNVGEVTVKKIGNTLEVTITAAEPKLMTEVHVYVGSKKPNKSAPGLLGNTYVNWEAPFSTRTFSIDISGIAGDIYIAAHAVVGEMVPVNP